ncbi:glycosyltransferase family 2 protein [Brevibacterium samyangense]|uniref:Glycosyltransferase family 2 protein n=1 Tax=Brevibacterium samyangense TaxID=366888 RepID=A0ABN2TA63_9MICO
MITPTPAEAPRTTAPHTTSAAATSTDAAPAGSTPAGTAPADTSTSTASTKSRRAARFAGLAVIAFTTLSSLALFLLIAPTSPRPFYAPRQAKVFGIEFSYDVNGPAVGLLVGAVIAGLLVAAFVAVYESRVSKASRRTHENVAARPLAPKRIMSLTRGVYAGPVTVLALIPAHNEEKTIRRTIRSLQAQSVPPERIVVVADNCTDDTVALARGAGAEVLETVDNADKKAGGLNQALAVLLPALGDNDTVLVMDADTKFRSRRFLEVARRRFTDDRALMAVGGLFLGDSGAGLLGQFQRNEFTRYAREIERRRGKPFVLTGTATVFRSAALRTVSRSRGTLLPGRKGDVYDTLALTEDNEITIALKSLGGLMVSPQECTVVTEIMPSWKLLWKQRTRWQRGALENLGQYGVTLTTLRYWFQQIGIGYSVVALSSYFAVLVLMLLAIDHWVWFTFWIAIGLVFMAERVITVWRGGWRARALAALVIPELVFDLFLDIVFVKGVVDMTFGREATWSHVDRGAAGTGASRGTSSAAEAQQGSGGPTVGESGTADTAQGASL